MSTPHNTSEKNGVERNAAQEGGADGMGPADDTAVPPVTVGAGNPTVPSIKGKRRGSQTSSDEHSTFPLKPKTPDGDSPAGSPRVSTDAAGGGQEDQDVFEDPLVGTLLDGRYRIGELIGLGGMGRVYRATQVAVGRPVAIKVLHRYLTASTKSVRRFNKEARAVCRLNHPNIVVIFDHGHTPENYLYMSMELLSGSSLKQLIQGSGPFSLDEAVSYLLQICDALKLAHSVGVIHRDLKPDNIMCVPVPGGGFRLKVLDFGIAKVFSEESWRKESLTNDVLGTPEYMPPEQIRAREVGPESDFYPMGVMLFEMLTGYRPFEADSRVELYIKHLNAAPAKLPEHLPKDGRGSARAQELLNRLLAKERHLRPADADELRECLLAVKADAPLPSPSRIGLAAAYSPAAVAEHRVVASYSPATVIERPVMADVSSLKSPELPEEPAIRCHSCGLDLVFGAAFCGRCGNPAQKTVVCETCRSVNAADMRFCQRCGSRLQSRHVRLEQVSRHTGWGFVEEQRRSITVVHAIVRLEPQWVASHDIEEQRDIMQAILQEWERTVDELKGTVHGSVPNGLVAVFGVPLARENDTVHALRCALMLRDASSRRRHASPERFNGVQTACGVAGGLALVSMTSRNQAYNLVGDALTRANDLALKCPIGQVLVADDVHADVKGLTNAVVHRDASGELSGWLVDSVRAADEEGARDVEGVSTRTIGRDEELGRLQSLTLQGVGTHFGQFVLVTGAAGVGKSRLLRDYVQWVQNTVPRVVVLRGRTTEYHVDVPYFILRDLFAAYCGVREDDPAHVAREKLIRAVSSLVGHEAKDVAERIGFLIGLDFPPESESGSWRDDAAQARQDAFFALLRWLEQATTQHPVVLVLEDLHWAEAGSFELIEFLTVHLSRRPFLIVASARPDLAAKRAEWAIPVEQQATLELPHLTPQNASRLVHELLQYAVEVPPAVHQLILDRSEGNPFYAEELVKVLVQQGVIRKEENRWYIDDQRLDDKLLPRNVRGLLQARMDALSFAEKAVLQAASVIGRTFWRGAVLRLLPVASPEDVQASLNGIEAAGFIYRRDIGLFSDEAEYQFEHVLLRECAYESLLRRFRKECHASVAAWLQERAGERLNEVLPLVGRHYELGENFDMAFRCYRQAGARAQAVFANEEALRSFDKALEFVAIANTDPAVSVADIQERRGDVLLHVSRHEDARRAFAAALAALGKSDDPCRRAELIRKDARVCHQSGNAGEARRLIAIAKQLCSDNQSAVRLALVADEAWVLYLAGENQQALAVLNEHKSEAEQPRETKDPQRYHRAYGNYYLTFGTVNLALGEPRKAIECFKLAREHCNTAGAKTAVAACDFNIAFGYMIMGRLDQARASIQAALALYEEVGYTRGAVNARDYLADVLRRLGLHSEAEEQVDTALSLARGLGINLLVAGCLTTQCKLLVDRGKAEIAAAVGADAVRIAEVVDVDETRGCAALAYGTALAALGHNDAALKQFRVARKTLARSTRPDELARAWQMAGELLSRCADRADKTEIHQCFLKAEELFTRLERFGEAQQMQVLAGRFQE